MSNTAQISYPAIPNKTNDLFRLQNDRQICVWMVQNLREQCELLELLVLYYKNVEHPTESILHLLTLFKVTDLFFIC